MGRGLEILKLGNHEIFEGLFYIGMRCERVGSVI